MTQETLVLKIPSARASELKRQLGEQSFEFRPVPYSVFSAKGDGVVATYYTSGKLVIQGDAPALFVERYLGGDAVHSTAARAAASAGPGATSSSDLDDLE